MGATTVKHAYRQGPRTILELACGHKRSIGAHVMYATRIEIKRPEAMAGFKYDCQDGNCYS